MNNDGKPDLIVANSRSSTVGVLLENGDGSFQAAISYASGGFNEYPQYGSVAAADVNGDGRADLVVTNTCVSTDDCSSGTVGVLLGNGNGTFQPVVIYRSGAPAPRSVAIEDLNGDRKPDLVVANCGNSGTCSGDGVVSVLLGNGDGTFGAAATYDSGAEQAISVTVGDVNADGKPDILVANTSGTVGVLLGNGDGTFRKATNYNSLYAQAVAVADVNGDGKPDLITSNMAGTGCVGADGSVGVLLGNGDGTFQPGVFYDSGGCVYVAVSVAVADVNRDGKPDLLVANYCASGGCSGSTVVGVLLGNGDGTFQPVLKYSTGWIVAMSLAVADLNGDGAPDLVVAGPNVSDFNAQGTVSVLLNNTTEGRSTTSTSFISSLNPSIYGQKVTWTATVTTSGSIPPTGKVNFTWGRNIGTVTLNTSGVATLTRSNLNADTYPLKAVYVGDANNLGSTSSVVSQVITQATSSATLTSSPNPSTQGQAVTFTATITSPTVTPTGPVTFAVGKTVLGTAQLSAGKAKLTTSTLTVGSTKVTATYYGNSNVAKTSASVTQTVR